MKHITHEQLHAAHNNSAVARDLYQLLLNTIPLQEIVDTDNGTVRRKLYQASVALEEATQYNDYELLSNLYEVVDSLHTLTFNARKGSAIKSLYAQALDRVEILYEDACDIYGANHAWDD